MRLEAPASPEWLYVGDPMCSWCWGFAPVLDELERRFPWPIRVVVGGLRPGPVAEPLTPRMRAYLADHWDQVQARTGQPFDHAALDRADWVYDTEPACTGVVTMRTLDETQALPFFKRLQRAFYAEKVDVVDPDSFRTLLDGFDVDVDRFDELVRSDEMRAATWRDFTTARHLGVTGFPTLLLWHEERLHVMAHGWRSAEDIGALVEVMNVEPTASEPS